ncbi:MAG: hypothetical protein JW746_02270 [Candidatus Krumholzibacteriota bacterium]|nr:hypothetical protein [Candidatus Krumholzibacteriota bacterium]
MRIGVLLLISSLLLLFFVSGCKETQSAEETGFKLVADNCISIGIKVFIDGEYECTVSADQPYFFPLSAGTYDLFARSNATLSISEPDPLCWTRQVSVSDGNITEVLLDCADAEDCNE